MFTLTAERPDGERLTLTQYGSAYSVTYAGFGPVAANVATSPRGMSSGDKINSTRRGKRNAVLYVTIEGYNVEQNRIRLYDFFTPERTVRLYYKNGARNVYTEGTVETHECDQFASPVVAQISIICPNPFWLGAEEIIKHISGVVSMFSFPFALPAAGVEMSSLTGEKYALLYNEGDEAAGFVATVYARANIINPVIYNALTNEAIGIDGTLEKGSTLTISTVDGNKRIKITDANGIERNVLSLKRAGSKWLKLAAGANYIAYAAQEGTDAMMVTLRHNELFVGV